MSKHGVIDLVSKCNAAVCECLTLPSINYCNALHDLHIKHCSS